MNLKELCMDIIRNVCRLDSVEDIHPVMRKRLDDEAGIISFKGNESSFMAAHRLLRSDGIRRFISFGNTAAVFTAYLLGLSNINPLPPHYRCQECGHIEFVKEKSVINGCDLPFAVCPVCGRTMYGDGHDLDYREFFLKPFKMCFGVPTPYYNGELVRDLEKTLRENPDLFGDAVIDLHPNITFQELGISFAPSRMLRDLEMLEHATGTVCFDLGTMLRSSGRLYSDEFEKYRKFSGIAQPDAQLAEKFEHNMQLDFYRRTFPEFYEKQLKRRYINEKRI